MSIKVMTHVWDAATYRGDRLVVLLALADFSNDEGVSWPSLETLAKKARLTRQGVIGVIRALEANGDVVIDRGGGRGRSNRYQLVRYADAETVNSIDAMEPETVNGEGETVNGADGIEPETVNDWSETVNDGAENSQPSLTRTVNTEPLTAKNQLLHPTGAVAAAPPAQAKPARGNGRKPSPDRHWADGSDAFNALADALADWLALDGATCHPGTRADIKRSAGLLINRGFEVGHVRRAEDLWYAENFFGKDRKRSDSDRRPMDCHQAMDWLASVKDRITAEPLGEPYDPFADEVTP